MDITQIPASRVPFMEENSGLVSKEWYRFFYNLYVLNGLGANDITSISGILKGNGSAISAATSNVDYLPANATAYPSVDNTHSIGRSGNRWTEVWATNGVIQTSDGNLKKDISDCDLGLEFICQLRPRSYKWVDKTVGETRYGFIAQEVIATLKGRSFDGVHYCTKTDRLGLNYVEFIAPLVQAIQDLKKEIDELRKQTCQQ